MHKKSGLKLMLLPVLIVLAVMLYQLPPIHERLSWRVDFALTYLRGYIRPASAMPTPLPQPQVRVTLNPPTPSPTIHHTPTLGPTATPTPSPTPLPSSVSLQAPAWEKQDINNCGPATLAMYLRYYGWEGDQFTISDEIKPLREDRNVNVEEIAYYMRTFVGWLRTEYRVGGNIELLKQFLAAGIPVMIEESFYFEESYWPNDDHWAAHYNLLTGYDDATQTFTGQDSYYGPDQKISYDELDELWQSFNRVYILIYPPEMEETVKEILGPDWDPDVNRQHALEIAQAETEADPDNAFAWFNLGTNLVYFERYTQAALAYDTARNLGLPQRMLRYQFCPFMAYFHGGRNADLLALTEYALERTPNSEEALLWRGWGLFREGKYNQAAELFRQALEENPKYIDAQYALNYLLENQ